MCQMVLDRYIAKAVVSGCLVVSFVLLSVFGFIDFVAQLKSMGTGDYGALQAAMYVLLHLPQRIYEMSPSIILVGGIFSLGAMAASSELTVMRSSGISTLRITRSVLQIGFVIAIIVAVVGEYVVPSATRMAKAYRAQAMEKKLIISGTDDVWARDGNRYVNVKQILPNHQLRGIRIFELDDNRQLSAMMYADHARYKNDEWVVDNIKKSDISLSRVTTSFQPSLKLKRLILLELFSVLELETSDMSAAELLTYSEYLHQNKLDDGEYRLAFWIKIFTPFTCLVMLMLAMPVVFTNKARSGGAGQRLMLAVLIGVIYFVLNRLINYLGLVLHISPVLSASAPLVLVMITSLIFMRRVN
ncbi:MAG: LPS export ABC transporter permease LptG [Gammaproteobacteria bacterium]|nr:LPS export ABC transporter permease LptG [Gammaproteobacteria bacterium]